MACLKFLSKCPCPRCLILKSRIPRIGSKTDNRDRDKLTRIDDIARQADVEKVRQLLFKRGVNLTSVKIERVLGPRSLVPTRVRIS